MEGYCYRSDGKPIFRELSNKVWEIFQKLELAARNPSVDINGTFKPMTSPVEFFQGKFEDILLSVFSENEREDARCVFNCLMNYAQFHDGGFLERSSVGNEAGYMDMPGGNIKIPAGIDTLINVLADSLPEGCIKFGREARGIQWTSEGVKAICSNNESFIADHVVITASLGYLKQHSHKLFDPPLPLSKIKSIENIPMGKVNKIFLEWNEPFWRQGLGGIKFCWTDKEYEIKSPREWYKRIFAFDEVLNNRNVLLGFVSGDEAEHTESLTDDEILETCTELIRKFHGNSAIPQPCKVMRSKWCTDSLSLGSYSYWGRTTTSTTYDDLVRPLQCGQVARVLFAGEATVPWAYGTMHAARSSGLREAKRIVDLYRPASKSHL